MGTSHVAAFAKRGGQLADLTEVAFCFAWETQEESVGRATSTEGSWHVAVLPTGLKDYPEYIFGFIRNQQLREKIMSESEALEQFKLMKRDLQRMRLAVIVIAAFFVYEALGPFTFKEERVAVQDMVKVKELIVVNDFGERIAYLGGDETGAGLILDDEAGNRLEARPSGMSLMVPEKADLVVRLRMQAGGIDLYDVGRQLIRTFPGSD